MKAKGPKDIENTPLDQVEPNYESEFAKEILEKHAADKLKEPVKIAILDPEMISEDPSIMGEYGSEETQDARSEYAVQSKAFVCIKEF